MQSSCRVIKATEVSGSELISPPIIERISSNNSSTMDNDEDSSDIYVTIIDEARAKANEIIHNAESRAKGIVDTASQNAKQIQLQASEDGFQDGYRNGYQEGYEYGINEASREAQNIRANADDYLKSCYREVQKFIAGKEKEIISLAVTIAQQVIGTELTTNLEIVNNIAQRVLARAMDKKQVILKVNPMDFNMVMSRKLDLSIYVENSNNLFIIADANINTGSVKAETSSGFIDGSIDTQLDIILKNLIEDL